MLEPSTLDIITIFFVASSVLGHALMHWVVKTPAQCETPGEAVESDTM